MSEKIKEYVKGLLIDKKIAGFLGLRKIDGHILPYLFCDPEELESFCIGDWRKSGDARYPLNQILIRLAMHYPKETFAVLVRGCDERGLRELFKWKQLEEEKVIPVGIGCPDELTKACECEKPFPDTLIDGPKGMGVDNERLKKIEQMEIEDRFNFWFREFNRCIKCFGCRNICPMCFCNECSLEEELLVEKGDIPPDNPSFHLVRAMHMVGRCIDCGLCEEACPAHIPLRTIYKKIGEIVNKEFGYKTGYNLDKKSPLNIIEVK